MKRSSSETKTLQSLSKQLQQSIFQLSARPVAPNCFRRHTLHVLSVLNLEFGRNSGVPGVRSTRAKDSQLFAQTFFIFRTIGARIRDVNMAVP